MECYFTKVAALVDAGFLKKINKSNGDVPLDYGKVFAKMNEGHFLLRNYFYDCKPYVSSVPTEDERRQQEGYDGFLVYMNKIDQLECKFGRLQKIGEEFTQKGVDTMLAIDIVTLATKRLITHLSVFSGDSDLKPAIEVAKNEGVIVTLFTHKSNVNNELVMTCDRVVYVDKKWFQECKRVNVKYFPEE